MRALAALISAYVAAGTIGAMAADRLPLKAPAAPRAFDWNGLYLGAHTGYGWGRGEAVLRDTATATLSERFGGLIGGVQVGYNLMLPSNVLVGVEADGTFMHIIPSNSIVASLGAANTTLTEQIDYLTTLRARLGYVNGPWMFYATGGTAFAASRVLHQITPDATESFERMRRGWAFGGGAELAIAPHWSLRAEYLHYGFTDLNLPVPPGALYTSSLNYQALRIGLNRRLDGGPGTLPRWPDSFDSESSRWEIHGQTTYIAQGHPSFRAPYSGDNSLTPQAKLRSTWSNSLFLNARLWDGGEFYFNPELLQGFGLNDTVGVAGFPNGEAQKSNYPYPHFGTSRVYLRQVFGFGGEKEMLESSGTQLGGSYDISRLTLQAGRFAVLDVFDGNSYAKDPRKDFMNWSIWAPGAFDYAADRGGLTYGVSAELNQKLWAWRGGYFLMDAESNSNNFDPRIGKRGTYATELELRYRLLSKPGKLRLIGWLNGAYSGSYRETLDNPAFGTDITQTRRGRRKYGYVVNVEQALSDQVGLFGRWSWNDGKTEIMAFTDIDASLTFGTSIKGTSWGRSDDTIGIAAAFNSISRDHRAFLAAGGMGPLIGDGALNYAQEKIVEAYYSLALNKQWTLTADVQHVRNPAYNADRGPVSIFTGRIHGEF